MEVDKLMYPELLWAGSDQSLAIAISARAQIMAGVFGDRQSAREEDTKVPYLFSQQGDTGVITIRGPLVNDDSPYNRYFGVTGYSDIRAAVIHAAQASDVKAIVLDISSGGGAVSGVDDTAALIAQVSREIKPVYTFGDGSVASAAYWIGSSATGGVYLSRTSVMGSIGVITTHKDYSKMFKDAGIGVSVIRAGKYKALANSNEPLSDAAREEIQAQLDGVYQVFAGHVASMRGVSMAKFEDRMGQGREFLGDAAVTAGLADGVTTYDVLLSRIAAEGIDSFGRKEHTPFKFPRGQQMKQALTDQQIQAIVAQVSAGDAGMTAEQATAAVTAAVTAALGAAKPAVETPAASANDAVVAMLQGQLTAANTQITALTVKATGLESQIAAHAAQAATLDALTKVVGTSLNQMKVSLGFSGFDASTLTAEQLVAEHTTTGETFAKKFPVGGVAAVGAPDPAAEKTPDPMYAARVAAARVAPQLKK